MKKIKVIDFLFRKNAYFQSFEKIPYSIEKRKSRMKKGVMTDTKKIIETGHAILFFTINEVYAVLHPSNQEDTHTIHSTELRKLSNSFFMSNISEVVDEKLQPSDWTLKAFFDFEENQKESMHKLLDEIGDYKRKEWILTQEDNLYYYIEKKDFLHF